MAKERLCAHPHCSLAALEGKNFCEDHAAELAAFTNREKSRGGWIHSTPPELEAAIAKAKAQRDEGVDEIVEVIDEGKLLAQWEKTEIGYVRASVKAGEQPMTAPAGQEPESGVAGPADAGPVPTMGALLSALGARERLPFAYVIEPARRRGRRG